MKEMLKRLLEVTEKCRSDMHEPDEQGISVIVTGTHLDNAMGDDPRNNCCEFTVGIKKEVSDGFEITEWFNLATLIALARKAKV
jgi:galactitol-specific phosphotransferase system IIB component